MATPSYKVTDLIMSVRQHTFSLEIDLPGLIDDEAEFVALHGFDWSKPVSKQWRKMNRRGRSRNHPNNPAKT